MKVLSKVVLPIWLLLFAVPFSYAGSILINELMYHPKSENSLEEFIELQNTGPSVVDLTGWGFTTGVHFTFPKVKLAAGAYLVVAADAAAFTKKYPDVTNFIAGWEGILCNSGQLIGTSSTERALEEPEPGRN